jgi:predicted Zn-dependent protease
MHRQGASFDTLSSHVAGHAEMTILSIVVLIVVIAAVKTTLLRSGAVLPSRSSTIAASLLLVGFVAATATMVARYALAPIRADTLAKHANAAIDAGQPATALRLLHQAELLAPGEASLLTQIARAGTLASRRGDFLDEHRGTLAGALASLEKAAELHPYDPDHPINLGRVLTIAASLGSDAAARQRLLERAVNHYARGVTLRPGSVIFRVEHAGALAHLGEAEAASKELKAATALDPGYAPGALMLAGLEHARAVAEFNAGRTSEARLHFEAALDSMTTLVAHGGGHLEAELAIASVYTRIGKGDDAMAVLEALVKRGDTAGAHEMLALLHLEAGRPELALTEAKRALQDVDEAYLPRAAATLRLVQSRIEATDDSAP